MSADPVRNREVFRPEIPLPEYDDDESWLILDGVMIIASAETYEGAMCAKQTLEEEGFEELEIVERDGPSITPV